MEPAGSRCEMDKRKRGRSRERGRSSHWAERAMMDGEFEEADADLLSDIVGRLGLPDVAEFGLRWQDSEEILRRLGYRATVTVSSN